MLSFTAHDFNRFWHEMADMLIHNPPVDVGQWQSQDISDDPNKRMLEAMNVSFELNFDPTSMSALQAQVLPNLPWAEDHFQERVSGEPLNPPPSEAWWPFAQQGNAGHKSEGEKFSHTYPERMWPKHAAGRNWACTEYDDDTTMHGIRFSYGDLMDVVNMLKATPMTRQAFLPIWFPEDTGAVHGKRVPCTLGYHFQIRKNKLYVTYYIRSCDIVRHMRDDVYMAARLGQWVASHLDLDLSQAVLTMHMANMHCFVGDRAMLEYKIREFKNEAMSKMMSGF